MENVSIHWARDLPASTRSAIEGLLGRNLRDDEEVRVLSLASHPAPSGDERPREIGSDEFDAAIDEAMNQIRPRRK
jgi:hypothetical protein